MRVDDLPLSIGALLPKDAVQPRWGDLYILHELAENYDCVIEFGSGVSTVFFSYAVPYVRSYESDARWFRQTVHYLSKLAHKDCYVELLHRPLTYATIDYKGQWTYAGVKYDDAIFNKKTVLIYIDGPELCNPSRELTAAVPSALRTNTTFDVVIDHRITTRNDCERYYETKSKLSERLCLFQHRRNPGESGKQETAKQKPAEDKRQKPDSTRGGLLQ
jgi:hypothetical protein